MLKFVPVLLAVILGSARLCAEEPTVLFSDAPRVLLIGDSLSVGTFGARVSQYLIQRCGAGNVVVRAACGSSPEHWLGSEPDFFAKCGYRQFTGGAMEVREHENGVPPPPYATPKIEALMERYRPGIVLVQLGTNWMDDMLLPGGDQEAKYQRILTRFATALHSHGQHPHVIWITPPDSAHFPKRIEALVDGILKGAARTHGFETIVSSGLTHYVTGKTGGDGVHYRREAAEAWAEQVIRQLRRKLRQAG